LCGIYGRLSLSVSGVLNGAVADRSVDCLAHRGPDGRGTWSGQGVFLGSRRLSIIDIEGGDQPIWNEDQTRVIVYNGELYNFLDLRPQLQSKGHVFRTRSDTEVVLHAYEEWGPGCLNRFNGMFAFALWDESSRTLFLARDRIGEKPLYYYTDDDQLVFASEIKSILTDPSIPRDLNPAGLANFLAFGHSVAPTTMYRDIQKLLPGHYLVASEKGIHVTEYWDVGSDAQIASSSTRTEEQNATRIRDLLDDSVRRRLIADVPVGAFLSGGVDSSAVVALMTRHAPDRVKTFSLGFTGLAAYNELSDAREVSRYLGTDHRELEVRPSGLVGVLEKLVYHYDEPFADAAAFPVYLLSGFAREHVKVVLTGDGGDELFGGYRRYAADHLATLVRPLLANRAVSAIAGSMPRLRRIKRALRTLPIKDPARRYAAWLVVFTPEMQAELLSEAALEGVSGHDPLAVYGRYYGRRSGGRPDDHLNELMYVDLKTWLADGYMEKTDKATMACSLEARLPFLDHRLVELAFEIPSRQKIRGWSMKRILKRAVQPLVPPAVLRKPKHGFSVPTDPWFRGDLKSFAYEVLFDDKTRQRGYFNGSVVERMYKEHLSGRNVWDAHLWLLMNFELWHRQYLDRAPAPSPYVARSS
jgi:asparagine synthase (glutamine-hydrolysing)